MSNSIEPSMTANSFESMRITAKGVCAKLALLTQRLGLDRASWFFARHAGFFDK